MLWNVPGPTLTPRVASWAVVAGLGVALVFACNSLTGADDVSYIECEPNELRSCSCTSALMGSQTCLDDASGFSECECAAGSGGTGGSGTRAPPAPRMPFPSGTGGGGTSDRSSP